MTYPGVLFWIIALSTAFAPGPAFYYVFFASWSFGTLAVAPPGVALGNLTPPWIAASLLTARVVLHEGPRRYLWALVDPRRFGALGLATLYGAASGYFLPRMFEDSVAVITMRPSDYRGAVPLRPDQANLTQGLYFVIASVTVVSVYFVCQDPARRRQFLRALGFGAVVAVLTGLIDLVTSAVGGGGLLEPFRNAQYALLVENAVLGMHRVVGLMSEASSYAGLCVPFLCLAVLMPAQDAPWGRWRLPLCGALFVMTYLSTSSAGYVGLGALAVVLAVSLVMAGVLDRRRSAWLGLYGLLTAGAALAVILLAEPALLDPVRRVIDEAIFHKTASASYIVRSTWNRIAYEAYLETHYLGVGIGGARASSWFYSLLSNVGLPGAALMFLFIAQVAFAPAATAADKMLGRAAKLAAAPYLLMACLASTSANFGLPGAMFLGLAGAVCWPGGVRRRERGSVEASPLPLQPAV